MMFRHLNLAPERDYVEQLRQTWLKERDRRNATIAECNAAHTTPAPNYWEAEHRARGRFLHGLHVLTILEGIV